jgi:hypothetical protein
LKPQKADSEGGCYFRRDTPCPFSARALRTSGVTDVVKIRELSRIYDLCRDPATHQSL